MFNKSHLNIGRFFLRNMSISALSAVRRFLFSSMILDAVLNSLSLPTLAEGALRNFTTTAARRGKRAWLFAQFWKGLSYDGWDYVGSSGGR